MSLKQKIITAFVLLGLILIAVFSNGLYSKKQSSTALPILSQTNLTEEKQIKVVSTNPSPLEEGVILPNQTIEITFNKPMVNDNSLISFDPKVDFTLEQNSDHKTLKISPKISSSLGKSFTLIIKSGYRSDTGEKLDHDEVFHFKTVKYTGV